jgi:N-acetylmuramoyl-L-alanine amidase
MELQWRSAVLPGLLELGIAYDERALQPRITHCQALQSREEDGMKIRLLVVIFLGGTVLAIACGFALTTSLAEGKLAGFKVCVDPGHGGSDPGAVNQDYDLHESDINLDVAQGLRSLLEADGAEVVLTRQGDEYKTNADRYTFCNDEQATILVSVHTNSVTDPSWDGSMALYAPSADSALAEAMYPAMFRYLREHAPAGVEFREFGLDHFASGVLFKCDMPAAMMEPLFMSNPSEAEVLVTPIEDPSCAEFTCRRGQIAQALYLGILDYFPGGGPPPEPIGTMHVESVDMAFQTRGRKIFIDTAVAIHDENDAPVSGARVTVDTRFQDNSVTSSSGFTGDDGRVAFRVLASDSGVYTSVVVNLEKDGWQYDAAASEETSETLTVP